MEITKTFEPKTRAAWRDWLVSNHEKESEIWILYERRGGVEKAITYLDIVEECLCFGWIDGIAKKHNERLLAQRVTPRRPRGNWTELNKERMRKLIKAGKMTPAGLKVAPDLNPDAFVFPEKVRAALQKEPQLWEIFQSFPAVYQRIRASYVDEALKNPVEYKKRLANLIENTRKKQMFGNWDDSNMPRSESLSLE